MGYFKCIHMHVPFCSIFVPFQLVMTLQLVVPCLHNVNMFTVLLIFALGNFKIGATKPISLDLVSPRWRGGLCVRGHGLFSLYSSYTKFK